MPMRRRLRALERALPDRRIAFIRPVSPRDQMTTSLSERVRATVAATLNLPLSAVAAETSAENNEAWDSLAQGANLRCRA
jgi:hypothetical protein